MGAKCTIDTYHQGAISTLQNAVVPYTPPSGNNLEHYYFPDSALPGGGDTWGVSMIGAVAALCEGVADARNQCRVGWGVDTWPGAGPFLGSYVYSSQTIWILLPLSIRIVCSTVR